MKLSLSTPSSILSTHDLGVSIGSRILCRGLNLSVGAGESLAVLGRNGAGKSTLLLTLAGLRAATQGQVCVDGESIASLPPAKLARWRGYCPQQQQDAFAATVLETALIGRHPHLSRWAWESADDEAMALAALARLGLAEMAERDVHTLSGGERQRLALAALQVQQPNFYLLDEPLAHLDLNHAMATLALFAKLVDSEGSSVIAVLHDPNLARHYFQRALLLFDDGSWLEGKASEVLTQENLSRLYDYPLQSLMAEGQLWFIPQSRQQGDHTHE